MLLNFNEFHAHPSEFLETGDDRVIDFGVYQGVSNSNKSFTVPFYDVYKLQDYKILQCRQFTDTTKILEAFRF